MIHLCGITVREKSRDEDYRAFLVWLDSESRTISEIRGYGDTPGKAADDAYSRFKEDRDFYTEDQWEQDITE